MNTFQIPVGPLHVALEEPMYFRIDVDGERVAAVEITAGHVHRGIEQLTARRNFWQNIVLTERVCSLCSNSHPQTYCMAVEHIAGIAVPARAHALRVVADEIKRIASHLFNVAILAHIVGFDSLFMHVMETREIMQDVKETIFGNRMDVAANTIGGVKYELSDERRRWLLGELDRLEPVVVDEITPLYATDRSILTRTRGVGVIGRDACLELGLVGPVARGSGVDYDVRRIAPYAIYADLDFDVITQTGGDVWSRAMVRLGEIRQSIRILRQCLAALPEGPGCLAGWPTIPAGEAIAKTEAPRGEVVYYLKTDGSERPERLKWRVPSYMNWEALGVMMKDARISDIPLIVNSIDPCISCTER
ncbi:MAG: carbon monoxide-induced hydrogenase [Phyllobacteriaceae bacterium]|nr:carbon monoxide-induced hydrogenase [Phyllobacteriaceae bacterium]